MNQLSIQIMPLKCFPFLQLAPEIRLQIYRLALPHSVYHDDFGFQRRDCPVEWHHGTCSSIIYVSRQVNREATELLFRENAFAIYVKHPRQPRLPMNEGRADPDSFVLISWAKRHWCNPKNPKMPLTMLQAHPNFRDIRRLHISLPPYSKDLAGIDMYMAKTSYAAFNGINAWIRKCVKEDCLLDSKEKERMEYVRTIKDPIDEVGKLIQQLPRLDQLWLSLQPQPKYITFTEYLLQGMLGTRGVGTARCFYVAEQWETHLEECRYFASLLQSPAGTNVREETHLPPDLDEMYFLLESIRRTHERDPSLVLPWSNPITA